MAVRLAERMWNQQDLHYSLFKIFPPKIRQEQAETRRRLWLACLNMDAFYSVAIQLPTNIHEVCTAKLNSFGLLSLIITGRNAIERVQTSTSYSKLDGAKSKAREVDPILRTHILL